jgi:hypothetical protein
MMVIAVTALFGGKSRMVKSLSCPFANKIWKPAFGAA